MAHSKFWWSILKKSMVKPMKLSLYPQGWLSLFLLLASLGWTCGCAMGIPNQEIPAGGNGMTTTGDRSMQREASSSDVTQRSQTSKYPPRRIQEPRASQARNRNGTAAANSSPVEGTAAGQTVPIIQSGGNRSTTSAGQSKLGPAGKNSRELAAAQANQANSGGKSKQPSGAEAVAPNAGTNLSLSDSPIPNPLRSTDGAVTGSTAAKSMNRAGQAKHPSAVQTVGYQEEIPVVTGEQIPQNPENITRLAMLEEPELAEPSPASVLESGEGNLSAEPAADPVISESIPAETGNAEQQLPWDENDPQQEVPIVSPQGVPATGSTSNLMSPAAAAQGHYQQGTAVFGQVLNEPQQTASQRAIQLLDENQRLREEMKSKLKDLESAQAKLKQQDELWARARQEFLEVRGVVDNLTRENSLLKMQIEKLEGEKVELARQYQGLMQTVEQTLDDLLLKAIAQPPAGNSPATTPATVPATQPALPPANAPAAQPPAAPPIVNGQQASALLKSQQ